MPKTRQKSKSPKYKPTEAEYNLLRVLSTDGTTVIDVYNNIFYCKQLKEWVKTEVIDKGYGEQLANKTFIKQKYIVYEYKCPICGEWKARAESYTVKSKKPKRKIHYCSTCYCKIRAQDEIPLTQERRVLR